ncbi:MAG: DUF1294 domain-containing protein [Planctomycetes bacterium]|nr:DUF1294 domain-containing protein [Planctomycetota bacterium]
MMRSQPIRFFLLVFSLPALALAAVLALVLDWHWLGAWLLAANLSALMLWAFDKIQARRGGWRVPELALHLMSILGATPAAFIGMKFLRHKTMKMHFRIFYALLFLVQVALLLSLTVMKEGP